MDMQRGITTPRSALARCLILACVIVGIYAFGPTGAHAGTYRVLQCHQDASGFPSATVARVGSAFGEGASCGSAPSGGLEIASNAQANFGDYTQWELIAPAGTLIRGVTLNYNLITQCGVQAYIEIRNDGGGVPVHQTGGKTDWFHCNNGVAGSGGINNSNLAARSVVEVLGCFGMDGVASCVSGAGGYGGAFARMSNVDLTLEDVQPPAAPAVAGSLVAGGPRRGTESLTVNGADAQSGVAAIDVYVNSGLVEHREPSCPWVLPGGAIAGNFKPCQPSDTETFSLATDAEPWDEGTNTLRACTTDYANQGGVGLTTCTDVPVFVDNSCDDSTGTTVGSNLDAGLATGNEQPRVNTVVSSKNSVQIKGSVTTSSGVPVAGANVCVYEQIATKGEDRVLADIVHTKSNGSYTSRVDPGPSRTVYVDYRHSNLLLEKQLGLSSTTSPVLKIRKNHIRNGHSMRFKGTIPGPYNSGRTVIMQARVGSQWRTFKQITTDTVGGFKGRYKFKNSTRAKAKYVFRTVVAKQDGYPYEAGKSNKAKVIVKG